MFTGPGKGGALLVRLTPDALDRRRERGDRVVTFWFSSAASNYRELRERAFETWAVAAA